MGLSPIQTELIIRALEEDATDKLKQVRGEEISLPEACKFWGIEDMRSYRKALQEFEDILEELKIIFKPKEVVLPTRQVIQATDIKLISDVHEYLLKRFSNAIKILQQHKRRKWKPKKGGS